MKRCQFRYQSSDGELTERTIGEWQAGGVQGSIEAYCELRGEVRTFTLQRMSCLIDLSTGEIISDPWEFFGVPKNVSFDAERRSIDVLTWEALPAIKALKFFTLTTRGFRKRERERVLKFAQEVCDLSAYSSDEISAWLQGLWCGAIYEYARGATDEYKNLLDTIPPHLVDRCRDYALWIAKGSGRKEPERHWMDRIASEFSRSPRVVTPQLGQDNV